MKMLSRFFVMLSCMLVSGVAFAYEVKFSENDWFTNDVRAASYIGTTPDGWTYNYTGSGSAAIKILADRSGMMTTNALQFQFANVPLGRTGDLRMGDGIFIEPSKIACDNIVGKLTLYVWHREPDQTIDTFQLTATTNNWDTSFTVGEAIPICSDDYVNGWRTFKVFETVEGLSQAGNELRIGVQVRAGGRSGAQGFLHSMSVDFVSCATPSVPYLVSTKDAGISLKTKREGLLEPCVERGRMAVSVNVSPKDCIGDLNVYGVLSRGTGTNATAITNELEEIDGIYYERLADVDKRLPFDAGEIITCTAYTKYKSVDSSVVPLGKIGEDGFACETSDYSEYGVSKMGSVWVNELGVNGDGLCYLELCGTANRVYTNGWHVVLSGQSSVGVTNVYDLVINKAFDFSSNMTNGFNGAVGVLVYRWADLEKVTLKGATLELKNPAGVIEFSSEVMSFPAHYQMTGRAKWHGVTPDDWSYDWTGTATDGTFSFELSDEPLSFGRVNDGQGFIVPVETMFYCTTLIENTGNALADANVAVVLDGLLNGETGTTNFFGQTSSNGTAQIAIKGFSDDASHVLMTNSVTAFAWKCADTNLFVSLYDDIYLTNSVRPTVAQDDFSGSTLKPYWQSATTLRNRSNVFMYWNVTDDILQLDTRSGNTGNSFLTSKGYMGLRGKRVVDLSFDFKNELKSDADCAFVKILISDTPEFDPEKTIESVVLPNKSTDYDAGVWYSVKDVLTVPMGFAADGKVWIRISAERKVTVTSAVTELDNLRVAAIDSVEVNSLELEEPTTPRAFPLDLTSDVTLDLSPLTGGVVSNIDEKVIGYDVTTNDVPAGTFGSVEAYEEFLATLGDDVAVSTVTNVERTLVDVTTNLVRDVAADLVMTINGNEFAIPFAFADGEQTNNIFATEKSVSLSINPTKITEVTGGFMPGDCVEYYARVSYDPDDASDSGERDVRYFPDNATPTDTGWCVKGGYLPVARSFTVPGPELCIFGTPEITENRITVNYNAWKSGGLASLELALTKDGETVQIETLETNGVECVRGVFPMTNLVANTEYVLSLSGTKAGGGALTPTNYTFVTMPVLTSAVIAGTSPSAAQLTVSGNAAGYVVTPDRWTSDGPSTWLRQDGTPNCPFTATVFATNKVGAASAATNTVTGYTCAAAATRAPEVVKDVVTVEVGAANDMPEDGNPAGTEYAVLVKTNGVDSTYVAVDGAVVWKTLDAWKTDEKVTVATPTLNMTATNSFSFVTRNFDLLETRTDLSEATTNCTFDMTARISAVPVQKASPFGTVGVALKFFDPAISADAQGEVEYSIGNGPWMSAGSFDVQFNDLETTADYAWDAWSAVGKVEGAYEYRLRAKVSAGARSSEWSNEVEGQLDFVRPTVELESETPDPFNADMSPMRVTVRFSEAVTGFESGKVSVENGTVTSVIKVSSAAGMEYEVEIEPNGDGTVRMKVEADKVTDAMGNGNVASAALTRTYDTQAPTGLKISGEPGEEVVTNGTAFAFEASAEDAVCYHWMTNGVAVADNSSAKLDGTAVEGTNTVSVSAEDAAGNVSSPEVRKWVVDTVEPQNLEIVGKPAALTNKPEFALTARAEDQTKVSYHWTFNGATSEGEELSGTATERENTVSVYATDEAENKTEPVEYVWTLDTKAPTVELSSATPDPFNGNDTFEVTVTFSEAVTGFNEGCVTVSNGVVGAWEKASGVANAYTVTIVDSTDGEIKVCIEAGKVFDLAGNGNTASGLLTRTCDTSRPTVTLESETPAAFNAAKAPMVVTVTFNEPVTNFTEDAVLVENGTARPMEGSLTPATTYTVTIDPVADGVVSVAIKENAVTDLAGNWNMASVETLTRTYDTTPPTAPTISGTPTNGALTNVEAVELTAASEGETSCVYHWDFNGTKSDGATLKGTAREGANSAKVTAEDAAGNVSEESDWGWTLDTVKPKVTEFTSQTPERFNAATPFVVKVTFSEPVTNFTDKAVVTKNVKSVVVDGSGTEYTMTVTPDKDGEVSVQIAAAKVFDLAGNGNEASEALARTYDNTKPTVTLASDESQNFNKSPLVVKVTFSEPVTNFTTSTISVRNGTVSGYSGSEASYAVNIVPTSDGCVTVWVEADKVGDLAGNGNKASEELTRLYDTSHPTVTLTSETADPFNRDASPLVVTATFSEPVTNFTVSSVAVENGQVSEVTGTDAVYSFKVTPDAEGLVTVKIPQDKVADAAGNGNAASEALVRTYDTTPPTVTLSSETSGRFKEAPLVVTATFSEAVTNFTADAVTVSNGEATKVEEITGVDHAYRVTIEPGEGDVTVRIEAGAVTDLAGNGNEASNELTCIFDNTPPTVTLASDAPEYFNDKPLVVTVAFSEEVRGFAADRLTVGNGTVKQVTPKEDANAYEVEIEPEQDGEVPVSIAAGAVTDLAGNENVASGVLKRTYDGTRPTVELTSETRNPFNSRDVFAVTAEFSEAVTNFTAEAVTVSNGQVTNVTVGTAREVELSPGTVTNVYILLIKPLEDGEITVKIAENAVADLAGNGNVESNELEYECRIKKPTVKLESTTAEHFGLGEPFNVTATFSTAVTNFTEMSISVSNGTVKAGSVKAAESGDAYDFEIEPSQDGTVVVLIAADVVADAAGNGNEASAALQRVYDTEAPKNLVITGTPGNGETTSRKTFSFAVAADEANVINAFQWKINNGTQITVSGVGKNTLTSDGRESLIVEGENTVIVRVRDSAMHWSEWTDGYIWIYNPSAGGGDVEFGGGVCVKVDADTGKTNEIRFTGLDLKPGAAGELTLDGFSASTQELTDFQMWLVVRDELEGASRRVKAGETATFDTTKGELKVEVPAAATEGAKSFFILGVDNHE